MQETSTKLEVFLSELQKTGTFESSSSVHAVTVRIPTAEFVEIEGFVSHSGMTRNKVIVHLLQVGLEQVRKNLSTEMKKPLYEKAADALRNLYTDEKGEFTKPPLEQSHQGEI